MIDYEKFYEIVEFMAINEGTDNNAKNIATRAFELFNNFEISKNQYGLSEDISTLLSKLETLVKDGNQKAVGFYDEITTELVYLLEKKIKNTRGEDIPFDFKPKNITFRKEFFSPNDFIEEDPNIYSDKCLSTNEYISLLSKNCLSDINKIQNEMTLDEFSSQYSDVMIYSLTQIDYIVKNHLTVVLVRFPVKDNKNHYDYRFCNYPDNEYLSAPVERKLNRLISIFNDKLDEARDTRADVMSYIEQKYNIDTDENYESLEDNTDWCYGIDEYHLKKLINLQ